MWPETGKSVVGFTFNKESRILKRCQFLALSRRDPRAELVVTAGAFLVIGRKNGLGRNRLGVTVTKKVAPRAVARNRIKRQVREFFRLNRDAWAQGLDLLFIARHGAARATGAQLRDDLQRVGRKLSAKASEVKARLVGPADSGSDGLKAGRPVSVEKSSGVTTPLQAEDLGGHSPSSVTPAETCSRTNSFGRKISWRNSASFWAMIIQQGPGRLALGFIRFYQRFISPLTPPACRFWPTCSNYAAQAIQAHGFWRGSWLTAWRLLKCHPFHPGGYDPVPTPKGKGLCRPEN